MQPETDKQKIRPKYSIKSLVKTVFSEFADDTTIHGFKNMAKSSNHIILKIIWLICFLVSTGGCIYTLYNNYTNYYSYPFSTKILVVNEIPTEFPTVTFCNAKSLDMSKNETVNYFNQSGNIHWYDEYSVKYVMANDKNLTNEQRKAFSNQ